MVTIPSAAVTPTVSSAEHRTASHNATMRGVVPSSSTCCPIESWIIQKVIWRADVLLIHHPTCNIALIAHDILLRLPSKSMVILDRWSIITHMILGGIDLRWNAKVQQVSTIVRALMIALIMLIAVNWFMHRWCHVIEWRVYKLEASWIAWSSRPKLRLHPQSLRSLVAEDSRVRCDRPYQILAWTRLQFIIADYSWGEVLCVAA